jgi:hypothetical protein
VIDGVLRSHLSWDYDYELLQLDYGMGHTSRDDLYAYSDLKVKDFSVETFRPTSPPTTTTTTTTTTKLKTLPVGLKIICGYLLKSYAVKTTKLAVDKFLKYSVRSYLLLTSVLRVGSTKQRRLSMNQLIWQTEQTLGSAGHISGTQNK